MGDPYSVATGVLSVVGFVVQVASGAMGMMDKTITAHGTQRRVVRNLQRELDKTIKGSTNMQIVLNTMLGNSKNKTVKRMCRKPKCIIALQRLTKALETTQECIEKWFNSEDSAPIVLHNALPSNRKSLAFVQAVFKHNSSPLTIDDAIEAVEELQFEVAKYRAEAESAFQHLWCLYNVQSSRIHQRHESVKSLASIENNGELISNSNDPTPRLQEQALRANRHPPAVSAHVLSDYEGEDAISEDDSSHASSTDTTKILEENQVSPTPVLVEASGTSHSDNPRQDLTTTDPSRILAILQLVEAAAMAVCEAVDKVIELKHEEQRAMKEFRKGVDSLKSDTLAYKVLMNAMENDTDLSGRSPYTRFIQGQGGREAMGSLEQTLNITRLLFDPAGNRHEAPIQPSGNKNPRISLPFVLNILKANFLPGHCQDLIGDLKDATREMFACQQNNERAFKLVWNLYVVSQQWTGRRSSVDYFGNIQGGVGQALDSVLHAFHAHPFSVSPEEDSRFNLPTLAILNRDNETATQYEKLARRIGKAWVDDRAPKDNAQVRDIGALQTSLFELLWSGTVEQLKRHIAHTADDPERPEFEKVLQELEGVLQESIVRSKKQRFAIAFCGMVKAGKSLFLNALMGRAILPSDELPSTAWPCRVRHVEGQTVPVLRYQVKPFLVALKRFRRHQYGRKMQTYQPPSEDPFEAFDFDAPSEPSEEETLLRTIHSQWIDLHAATRDNLLKFETPGFRLPRMANGEQNVKDLLGQLNDIIRLCKRFDLQFDMSEVDWPLLTVEFNSLRGHRMDGIYEFIDLPGIGEGFRDFNFESLVRLVASDSNAIVPIVSFKEISRSDWTRLPDLVTSGSIGRANVVICTHLDHISQDNMEEQLKTVTKTFWPKDISNTNRVVPCSTLMGLSARDLLDSSNKSKPPFGFILNKHVVGYHCAAKILGMRMAEATYDSFDIQEWRRTLQAELHNSGLPVAIRKLTKELAESARIDALLREADTIINQLRKMSSVQERKLLEARRTEDDYNFAKSACDQARDQLQSALDTWNREENLQIQENRILLEKASITISQKAYGLIGQAMERTLEDWRLKDIQSEDGDLGRGPRGASAGEEGGVKVLTVKTKAHAEEFLRLSQQALHSTLNALQLEYVTTIRKLAEAAKDKRFRALEDAIKHLGPRLQPELREEIVGDLKSQSIDIRKVAFQQIRNVIKTTATRHTALTAFRAIEVRIARPWLGPGTRTTSDSESNSNLEDKAEVAAQRSIDELGFMLRAPITMLATVPFVFGLPIWPWVVHSRAYHLGMDVIHNQYKDEIVDPWIRSLNKEGEQSLIGTIKLSSKVAKDLVTSALEREDNRYKRELDGKNKPVDQGAVQHLIAIYGNLVAAEEALRELFRRVEGLQARSGQ